jgi:hypothetical protein
MSTVGGRAGGERRKDSRLRRRILSLLVAMCALWSFFAGPASAAAVALLASARPNAPVAAAPAAAHRCGMCSPAAHTAGKKCCCDHSADSLPADALCFRALCGPVVPDAALPGVSPCPPAVLPASPAAPAPLVLVRPAADAAARPARASHPAHAGLDRPPRARLS